MPHCKRAHSQRRTIHIFLPAAFHLKNPSEEEEEEEEEEALAPFPTRFRDQKNLETNPKRAEKSEALTPPLSFIPIPETRTI